MHLQFPAGAPALVLHLVQGAAGHRAGVVHQDVDVARLFAQAFRRAGLRQVQRVHAGLPAGLRADGLRGGMQGVVVARHQDGLGAFAGERDGAGQADALGCARDEHAFTA
ncbi:hypothetical protein D9M72_131030 [compost metagenome]